MKIKMIAVSALAVLLITMPVFSSAASSIIKEYEFIAESSENPSYDARDRITEDGTSYKLKDISYEVIEKLKPAEKTVNVTVSNKADLRKSITIERDGKKIKLYADENNIRWNTVKEVRETKSIEYIKGESIPSSISGTKDDNSGNAVSITLNLKSTEEFDRTEEFSTPAYFYSYSPDTRIYELGGNEIEIDGDSPKWNSYQESICDILGLNGNEYSITDGKWESTEKKDGRYVRTARYYGTRTMHIVNAVYEETESTAYHEYQADVTYTEKTADEGYRIKATTTYSKVWTRSGIIAAAAGLVVIAALLAAVLMRLRGRRNTNEKQP